MSLCSSRCDQLIIAFVERIVLILTVLQSLYGSQGAMGPQGPVIWLMQPVGFKITRILTDYAQKLPGY